jgi:hypothetical protein
VNGDDIAAMPRQWQATATEQYLDARLREQHLDPDDFWAQVEAEDEAQKPKPHLRLVP